MRPRLLDLFCGAGGAGMGYHRAGFDVVGVDIKPQPRYPFAFHQADALEYCREHGREFDAIHASPPCQAFTMMKTMPNAREHLDLLTPTREMLKTLGLPYVIENVRGAPMPSATLLCGTAFGLGVEIDGEWFDLRRHRQFESGLLLMSHPCRHGKATLGLYGDHVRDRRRLNGSKDRGRDFSDRERMNLGVAAMDMPWVETWEELRQAIPPAYTEHLGRQLLAGAQKQAA